MTRRLGQIWLDLTATWLGSLIAAEAVTTTSGASDKHRAVRSPHTIYDRQGVERDFNGPAPHYRQTLDVVPASTRTEARDRWLLLLVVTMVLNLQSAFLFPHFVTDAFSLAVFVVSVTPVIWGFSALFLYRSKRERFAAWLAIVGAIYWLIPTIGIPIEFLGR